MEENFLKTICELDEEIDEKNQTIKILETEIDKAGDHICRLKKEAIDLKEKLDQPDDYTVVNNVFPLVMNYFFENNFLIYDDFFMNSGQHF